MRRWAVLLTAMLLCAGCASTSGGRGGMVQRYTGSKQLEQAEEMLARGDSAGAAKTLGSIVNAPSVDGVTDAALFRLALLTLKPGAEKPASAQAHQLLKRLDKEYPRSPWTHLASPLTELIGIGEELKRQNKTLKGANQSLTKEIGELNKRMEQLKHLDQELERKSR
ncbi:MAG TPA: hypothetical protein DCZ75_05035 [Geobacter sp.]|nr:hypothetical protein [Geobacter sp.]